MLFTVAIAAFATLGMCFQIEPRNVISNYTSKSRHVVPSYNIAIPVDHFNFSDTRVYNNRYWVNDTFYQPGGPVFFFDHGMEGISNETAAAWLAEANGSTSVMALAAKYHGLAILWEHRYYGESLPVRISANTSSMAEEPADDTQDWSYLTFEQALEDVVYFATNLQRGGYQTNYSSTLAPSVTPWIWLGKVYSGGRGAILRKRNPEIIYAVWASSALVESIYDGSTWFDAVESSMPSNCSTDVRLIVAHVDRVLSGDSSVQEYLDLQRYFYLAYYVVGLASVTGKALTAYNLSQADTLDPSAIATIMSSAFRLYPQDYGPSLSTNIFCDYLESYNSDAAGNVTKDRYISVLTNPGNGQPTAKGLLASHGDNTSLGVQAYAFAAAKFQDYALTQLPPIGGPKSVTASNEDAAAATYQYLTELGWIIGSNPDNITIISKFANYTGVANFSESFFFSQATADTIPHQPNTNILGAYAGWYINPSNVMFTNGQFDPWRAAGVFAAGADISYYPTIRVNTTVPTGCGSVPDDGTYYSAIYPNAGTGWDLQNIEAIYKYSIDAEGKTPQPAGYELFTAALDAWLDCFNEPTGGGGGGGGSPTFNLLICIPIISVIVLGSVLMAFFCLRRRAVRASTKAQNVRHDSYSLQSLSADDRPPPYSPQS